MARVEIKQSGKLQLTSYSGLALVGQRCQIAGALPFRVELSVI
jgi:hypothetical protein